MIYSVFDLEANGLLDTVTKIHCLSTHTVDTVTKITKTVTYTTYEGMREFILGATTLIGHKIITYDVPVLEKVLGIKVTARLIDTLGLSWYLFPNRVIHGLDSWGKDFFIEKPPIVDWEGLPLSEYVYRCSEDVRINVEVFKTQKRYLQELYGELGIDRIMSYLSYKLDCAKEQEDVKWKLDIATCTNNLDTLTVEREKKRVELAAVMPRVARYKIKSKPKVMACKDGSVSKLGEDWYDLLHQLELPDHHIGAIKLLDYYEEGNPNSPPTGKGLAGNSRMETGDIPLC